MGHRAAVCKCLLLVFIWSPTASAILEESYRLQDGALVTLVALHSGATLEGNFSILVEFGIIWDEHNMPICAEVLSRKVAQSLICTALGMKHAGLENYTDSYKKCYSLKYQQVIKSSGLSGAKIACIAPTTDDSDASFNIVAGGLVNIAFRSSDEDKERNSTGLSFNMQVNKMVENNSIITSNICVHALLNVSSEEKEQLTTLFKGSSNPDGGQCNKTICLAVISQTHVQNEHEQTETESHVATSQHGVIITPSASTPEHRSCDSHLVQDVVQALILIILVSIVIVLCSALIYTNCCCRKAKRKRFTEVQELNTLLASRYADSAVDLADTHYIQMDAEETGHMTHSHAAASASLHRRLDVHGQSEEDPGYDELSNCNMGCNMGCNTGGNMGGAIDGSGYSHLNHSTSD